MAILRLLLPVSADDLDIFATFATGISYYSADDLQKTFQMIQTLEYEVVNLELSPSCSAEKGTPTKTPIVEI